MEFHQTSQGKRFYDSDLPRLAKALERIAAALEKSNEMQEKKEKIGKKEKIQEYRNFLLKKTSINESTSTDQKV